MTEIDFYTHVEDRLRVTCQLIQKARARNLRVLVQVEDEAALRVLDEKLWTFQAHSFLAHCRVDEPHAAQTPVLLSCDDRAPPFDELLVNLRAAPPQHFARFQRVLEIVSLDERDRSEARERFRFYRDRGYTLRTHVLGSASNGSGTPAGNGAAPGSPS